MSLKLIRIARLKQLGQMRNAVGPAELGQLIGRKTNQTSDLLHGRASFGEKVARSIEEVAGMPLGWLDQDGDAPTRELVAAAPAIPESQEIQAETSQEDETMVHVPLLATYASMGPGHERLADEFIVGKLSLSYDWIIESIRPLTRPSNLRLIPGDGDSMSPTFNSGDILLVDAGIREILADGVYALEAENHLFIKRVRRRLDGSYEVSSDNPNVKTVDVLGGDHTVHVLGRVVWVWIGKRMN